MKLLHPVNNRKSVGFSEMERLEAKLAISNNVAVSMVQVRFMQASYFWNGARFLPLDKLFFRPSFYSVYSKTCHTFPHKIELILQL